MSDPRGKRKWAGEPIKDKRNAPAPDFERLPPHKKPRMYRLTVRYERTTTATYTKEFPSKAAMQEHRARVAKVLAAEKVRAENPKGFRYRYWYGSLWDLKMDCHEEAIFRKEPEVIEETIEVSPGSASDEQRYKAHVEMERAAHEK